jgi:hypothetical protein
MCFTFIKVLLHSAEVVPPSEVVPRLVMVPPHLVLLLLAAATNKLARLVRAAETAMVEILSEVVEAASVQQLAVEVALARKPSQVVALVVSTPGTTSNSKVTRSRAADSPVLDKIFSHLLFHDFSLRIYFMFYVFSLTCRLKHV